VTAEHGNRPTVDPNMPWEATVTRAQFDDAARQGGGYRWYPRTAIARTSFELGATTNALNIELRDRNRVRFMWLAADGGRALVEEWLAGRPS
jgi:hypothetical protein